MAAPCRSAGARDRRVARHWRPGGRRHVGKAAETGKTAENRPVTYRVKRGDTLFSIAQLFNTTVAKLRSLNRLRTSQIAVGDRLTVGSR